MTKPAALHTPEEVAGYFKVKPKTVREWLRTGRLKGTKVGGLWQVREEDLETFLVDTGSWRGLSSEDARPEILEGPVGTEGDAQEEKAIEVSESAEGQAGKS